MAPRTRRSPAEELAGDAQNTDGSDLKHSTEGASGEDPRAFSPAPTVAEQLAAGDDWLTRYRGRDRIGLPTGTFPDLDEMTLGLRGLFLLAAMPGIGKTTLTAQWVLSILQSNPEAAAVFVSLEMPAVDLRRRAMCFLAEMPWRRLMLGDPASDGPSHTPEELDRIERARTELAELGERLVILEPSDFGDATSIRSRVVLELAELKRRTGATRSIAVVDYLDLMPVPPGLESLGQDRARLADCIAIRDRFGGDPIIGISAARKPGKDAKGGIWGATLADAIGSSAKGFACDIGGALRPITDRELRDMARRLREVSLPAKACDSVRDALAAQGEALVVLDLEKARDGMTRGRLFMTHRFTEARMEERPTLPASLDSFIGDADRDIRSEILDALEHAALRGWVGLTATELCGEVSARRDEVKAERDRLVAEGEIVREVRPKGEAGPDGASRQKANVFACPTARGAVGHMSEQTP